MDAATQIQELRATVARQDGYNAGYRDGLADAARLCLEEVTRRAGYNGQWEGYGPSKGYRTGPECAAVIRSALDRDSKPPLSAPEGQPKD